MNLVSRLKQVKNLDSTLEKVENLEEENSTLKASVKELEKENKSLKVLLNQYEEDISENYVPLDLLSYELRTSNQTGSKNKRYYYKSNYLFTAPQGLLYDLTIEFNRLMNMKPKLTFDEVSEELRTYKDSLMLEVSSTGKQLNLGV